MDDEINFDSDSEELKVFNNNKLHPSDEHFSELIRHQIQCKLSDTALQRTAKFANQNSTFTLPSSVFKIKKRSEDLRKRTYNLDYETLIQCIKCEEVVNKREKLCKNCQTSIEKSLKKRKYMIYIPIEQQIQKTLSEHFSEIIEFLNRKKRNTNLCDVDDGILFENIQKEFKPNSFVLSLTLNIDGAEIYHCSKNSMWLVQLYQNYLPPNIRFRQENIILAAIYFDTVKPDVFDLIYPLSKELSEIQKRKISVFNHTDSEFHDFVPFITIGSCDLPAKQMLQNFTALTGYNSCSYCQHPGEAVINTKKKQQFDIHQV